MRGRILYVMHVDWNWIKQRPHFLAEELAKEFDVLVMYPRAHRRSQLVRNATTLRRLAMIQLPFGRFRFIAKLNDLIRGLYFRAALSLYRPSVVFLTFPTIVPHDAMRKPGKPVVVYDCMDDAPAFSSDPVEQDTIFRKEQSLIPCTELILVSSRRLEDKMLRRGATVQRVHMLRNAFNGVFYTRRNVEAHSLPNPERRLRALFFGAVGDHLDFDALLHCLHSVPEVEFYFVGPVMIQTPEHERLKFLGPVQHAELSTMVEIYDVFILPFKINELVASADPVKMYEYINFNKNIVSAYYPELERFSEFVMFYRDQNELAALMAKLVRSNQRKYNEVQREAFLKANDWRTRGAALISLLKEELAPHNA